MRQGIRLVSAAAEAGDEICDPLVVIRERGGRFRPEVQEEGPRTHPRRGSDLLDGGLVESPLVEQAQGVLGEPFIQINPGDPDKPVMPLPLRVMAPVWRFSSQARWQRVQISVLT